MCEMIRGVYKVSILAKRPIGASGEFESEHRPFILHAESIETAETAVKDKAFETWDKEAGWSQYEAYIAPTTAEDYTAITGIQVRAQIIIKTGKEVSPRLIKFQAE